MARCGKDTFAAFVDEIFPTLKYSSIDGIKRIAKEYGGDGKKDEKSRKFLSDLKLLTSEYNNLSFMAMAKKVNEFKNDRLHHVMLIDIREPAEIEKAKNAFGARTILIRNNRVKSIASNIADANVFNYKYDFEIENSGTLDEFRNKVSEFVKKNIIEKNNENALNKTIFNWFGDDWTRVKNHCRTTDNKEFTENNVTDTFKKKLLISEHSPIRLLEFDWSWKSIFYWLSTEWSRHKFEKFISSQRDDRLVDEVPRGEKPQKALVNFDGYANMQNLIDAWRKRLCCQATKEARELAEDFKKELKKTHSIESDVLVPNCIYRCGCPEFKECGYIRGFTKWLSDNNKELDWLNIQERYDLYNEYFHREV